MSQRNSTLAWQSIHNIKKFLGLIMITNIKGEVHTELMLNLNLTISKIWCYKNISNHIIIIKQFRIAHISYNLMGNLIILKIYGIETRDDDSNEYFVQFS